MSDSPPPAKRKKYDYDLTKSFDVLVGKEPHQQRFVVHHDLITHRSEFFRAARFSRWNRESDKPTTLDDHDPEIFSIYLHCLYFGVKSLEERLESATQAAPPRKAYANLDGNVFTDVGPSDQKSSSSDSDVASDSEDESESSESGSGSSDSEEERPEKKAGLANQVSAVTAAINDDSKSSDRIDDGNAVERDDHRKAWTLIDLYLLADKLIDPTTANLVIDQLIRFVYEQAIIPTAGVARHVYRSTEPNSPLRILVRDWYIHEVKPSNKNSVQSLAELPRELLQDIIIETSRLNLLFPRGRHDIVFSTRAIHRQRGHYHQSAEDNAKSS